MRSRQPTCLAGQVSGRQTLMPPPGDLGLHVQRELMLCLADALQDRYQHGKIVTCTVRLADPVGEPGTRGPAVQRVDYSRHRSPASASSRI